ncbi:MAG: PhoH family protein [Propionicimonas sp.]|uniref:PhoH family protein n=1 Tax=Propionicimonas sp. TaxID=1955623 RepID=UPI002B214B56|nr:PhoH family protein [Propionicimonas sp.]MEA4943563.1 PhoH family protein [Propionicimonas sp.]MEA5053011.1 PhoH family protein [Propionicimonas sp.]MEA5116402.1 PhoH family protein [Propionicimonas sp.]
MPRSSTRTAFSSTAAAATGLKTFVLDTSVLLSDPHALRNFAEHAVVIPIVVITELEAKRHHPELGYFARTALRFLDDLRVRYGTLDSPVPVNQTEGTVRVELNHTDPQVLPPGFRLGDNDSRILAVALNYRAEGHDVVLVSKDLPMRVKASAVGLAAEEYLHELAPDSGWTGMAEVDVAAATVEKLYADGAAVVPEAMDLPCHTGVVLHGSSSSALGRMMPDGSVHLIRDREAFGIHGRSAEQRVALDLLLDPEIGIVSLGGRAGTGKSALALCAGLEAVLERQQHAKVIVFRPLYPVGGQELGYLPGSEGEKMTPWAQAVFDTLSAVTSKNVIDEVLARNLLEVMPLTHIRGRSLHDAFVIVDEAQSLERNVLLTVLSRIGQNSRVVLTHDVAQRDNLRVGRHDGVVAVVEKLKGNPMFAHVTLTRSERSPIAALVTELLDDILP